MAPSLVRNPQYSTCEGPRPVVVRRPRISALFPPAPPPGCSSLFNRDIMTDDERAEADNPSPPTQSLDRCLRFAPHVRALRTVLLAKLRCAAVYEQGYFVTKKVKSNRRSQNSALFLLLVVFCCNRLLFSDVALPCPVVCSRVPRSTDRDRPPTCEYRVFCPILTEPHIIA